jgi:hypothetical protein
MISLSEESLFAAANLHGGGMLGTTTLTDDLSGLVTAYFAHPPPPPPQTDELVSPCDSLSYSRPNIVYRQYKRDQPARSSYNRAAYIA